MKHEVLRLRRALGVSSVVMWIALVEIFQESLSAPSNSIVEVCQGLCCPTPTAVNMIVAVEFETIELVQRPTNHSRRGGGDELVHMRMQCDPVPFGIQ